MFKNTFFYRTPPVAAYVFCSKEPYLDAKLFVMKLNIFRIKLEKPWFLGKGNFDFQPSLFR